ncbi:L,D-transpeptidase family protein [Ferrimonas futtsuensis]|uniref:L,D-transpeptidase family protein n=1 Tax=Ferrimonas futtsuensis TaxID=364764 RepID=UPI00041A80F4|nr:L,D-transpeptidase family protein [Ferrimonas futtsuensis]
MRSLLLLLLTLSLPLQGQTLWPAPGSAPWADHWYRILVDLEFSPALPEDATQAFRASERLVRFQASLRGVSPDPVLEALAQASSPAELQTWVSGIAPSYQAFERLRAALHEEQKLADLPRPDFTDIRTFSLGQSHPELVPLRRLLAARLGDTLPPHLINRDVWDPPLIDALRRFQRESQLPASGRLTADTIDALSLDNEERLAAIRFSLRQWLQLPPQLSGDAILVNLPHYQLMALEGKRVHMVLPVIIGAPDTPTPRFNSRFSSVTLNPSWTPPWSIIKGELLPAYRRDSNSLKRQGFELIDPKSPNSPLPWKNVAPGQLPGLLSQYQLKQRPGSNNALGSARLNLVNSNAIFLHDTPNQKLFLRPQRALSHGCIRIQNIDRLLAYLERNIPLPERQKLQYAKKSRDSFTQSLGNTAKVYIVYMPAWPKGDNSASIAADIYNLI